MAIYGLNISIIMFNYMALKNVILKTLLAYICHIECI